MTKYALTPFQGLAYRFNVHKVVTQPGASTIWDSSYGTMFKNLKKWETGSLYGLIKQDTSVETTGWGTPPVVLALDPWTYVP